MIAHLHFKASMSFPGVSKHRRIKTVCCRTTVEASSSNRAWSSTGGGEDSMVTGMNCAQLYGGRASL